MPTGSRSRIPEPDAVIDDDALRRERLRRLINQGIDEIERGNFTEVDDKDLDAFLDSLAEAPQR